MKIHKPSSLGRTEAAVRERIKMLLDEEVSTHREQSIFSSKPAPPRGPIRLSLLTQAVRGTFGRK